jgi:hypothetical protein
MFKTLTLSLFAAVAIACVTQSTASEVDELRERAAAMKREIVELMERGRHDEAEKAKRGLTELAEQIKRYETTGKTDLAVSYNDKQKLMEAGRRLKHIYQAAEHLTAAGMQDMADQLRKHAAEMEKELHRVSQEKAADKVKRDKTDADDLTIELRKMREQVEKLRAEVDELRGQLKR